MIEVRRAVHGVGNSPIVGQHQLLLLNSMFSKHTAHVYVFRRLHGCARGVRGGVSGQFHVYDFAYHLIETLTKMFWLLLDVR